MYDLLAIDWGEKKIGICLGSSHNKIAIPKPVISYLDLNDLLSQLQIIIHEKKIQRILIGYPTNFKGEKTNTSVHIDKFIDRLKTTFDLEIIKVIERGTTKNANNLINNYGDHKIDEDSISALLILNNYLDE